MNSATTPIPTKGHGRDGDSTELLREVDAALRAAWEARTLPASVIPAELAQAIAKRLADQRRPFGCLLAMAVLQSDLYKRLDEVERAECDELVARNLEWFRRDASPLPDQHSISGEKR